MRKLAIALLNDDEGITVAAWDLLKMMLNSVTDHDIISGVECTEGRCYLPESWEPETLT